MDYVSASTAFDLAMKTGNPMEIPKQFQAHFFSQIARIMVELASITFTSIGSVIAAEDDEQNYVIGPYADTMTGPYSSAKAFYNSYPLALANRLQLRSADPLEEEVVGTHLAQTFQQLAAQTTSSTDVLQTPLFSLVNLELGTHNILVDADYNVLGVIDWDSTFAMPNAGAHMFPFCSGAEPGVPGATTEVSPVCPPLNDERRQTCNAFAQAVEEAALVRHNTRLVMEGERPDCIMTHDMFFSREALALRSLMFLKAKQTWVDEAWPQGIQWLVSSTDETLKSWYC